MSDTKKPIIAVVTSVANSFAEKELLNGIISENMKNGYSTVVFSNIYNLVQQDSWLLCEQRIYDLVHSPDISGIILMCESFIVEHTRESVASLLAGIDLPIVGIGARLEEFDSLNYTLLSTDDCADVEKLTSHLVEAHGFTDIDFLSGFGHIETSRLRAEGYLNALRKHGIEPDEKKVFYGDFWYTSGEQLADRYINGELRLPQAVICANDNMAYGMLRRLSDAGIRIPEQLTVVSYDHSDHRIYYSPALTSYCKGRKKLGAAAAKYLQALTEGRTPPVFTPPEGSFVFGSSCPCRADEAQSISELRAAEQHRIYSDFSLFSTMDQKLTLCRDLDGFIRIMSEHQWLIQDIRSLFMCLYSDWNENSKQKFEIMRVMSIHDNMPAFEKDHLDLRSFFDRDPDAAVCYLNPIFSGQNLFGYMALLYSTPRSYEDVYRHWLKSVSIGLEVLRLKNDIRYLISCQNVSEYRDTLTGLNNKKGLRRAFQAVRIHGSRKLYIVMLRTDLFPRQLNDTEIRRKTEAMQGVSRVITKFCGNHDIAGRTDDDTFVCAVQTLAEADVLTDLMASILVQDKQYMSYAGVGSFACAAVPCDGSSFDDLLARAENLIMEKRNRLAELRKIRGYAEMLKVRDRIYSAPEVTFEPDSANASSGHIDYFRRNYKKCFGITFHQDCINARLARAKYYLVTTSLSISDISEKCGYLDCKFFQRQFSAGTEMTPIKYRNLIKG